MNRLLLFYPEVLFLHSLSLFSQLNPDSSVRFFSNADGGMRPSPCSCIWGSSFSLIDAPLFVISPSCQAISPDPRWLTFLDLESPYYEWYYLFFCFLLSSTLIPDRKSVPCVFPSSSELSLKYQNPFKAGHTSSESATGSRPGALLA